MTRGGARLRAYIHEQTAQKLPSFCLVPAVLNAAATLGQCVAVFLTDGQILGVQGIFIIFTIFACAAFAAAAVFARRVRWETEE